MSGPNVGVPALRFPEFNDKWDSIPLSGVAFVYDGVHQTPSYTSEGVPFYSVENVTSNDFVNTKYVSAEDHKSESRRVTIERGDTLMTRIGDIGTAKFLDWDVTASFYVSLCLIKPGAMIHDAYVQHAVRSSLFQSELYRRTIHVAFPKKINLGEIGRCYLPLPTLPEQRRIADALSAVDSKIDLLTRKRDNLARFKAGLMQKIFSQEVRFTREDGSAYPDWEEKELGDIATAKTSNRTAGSILDEEGSYAVYGAAGIITRITSYDVEAEHIGIVKDGAGAGRVMMCEPMSSITGTMVSLTTKSGFCLRYLHQYLQTVDFSSYVTGSTIPHIYFRDYKHERSSHPCWEEQVRISSFLDSINSRVALVDEKITAMQTFKKGLLQQMFV